MILSLVYFLGIFDHGLWAPMDTVGAGMIWGMHDAGSWAVPLLNGQPYLEKPPLMHWTALVLIRVTGRLNEALIRMPSALYGWGAVLIVYYWGRREHSPRVGLCAAFLCTGSLLYLEYSKSVLTDATLVFVVILSMQLFWWAYSRHRNRTLEFAPFLLASSVAFFAKGLVGVVFVWIPIMAFLAYRRQWRWFFLLPTLYLPVFSLLVGIWAYRVWLVGGEEYLRIIFVDNQLGRFFTFSDASLPVDPYFVHKEGLFYYLWDLPPRILPWVVLVPAALYYWFRRSAPAHSDFSVYLKFALVVMLLILHASSAKVSEYALPMLPILFYLTAVWLDTALTRWNSPFDKWTIVLAGLCAGIVALLPPLIIISLYLAPQGLLTRYTGGIDIIRVAAPRAGAMYLLAGVALTGMIVGVVGYAGSQLRTERRERLADAFPGTITLLLMIGLVFFTQCYDPQRSCKPVADSLLQQMRKGRQIALGTDAPHVTGCMTFYLQSKLPVHETFQAATDFLGNNRPAALLIEKDDLHNGEFATHPGRFAVTPIDYPGIAAQNYALIRN
ncbi:MAG: glycosyltransferase family 39 protein [Gammaproteobacteria bacterium]|nr:glycosyltransferase family 39 protein [Gammaproteobacteria bacterium]MDE2250639.1 glycosyltransferase family 39 protein [Gammaproteobacteria bacterium]